MVHLGFGVLKLTVVLAVAGVVLYNQREALLGLIALPPPALAAADGATSCSGPR